MCIEFQNVDSSEMCLVLWKSWAGYDLLAGMDSDFNLKNYVCLGEKISVCLIPKLLCPDIQQ